MSHLNFKSLGFYGGAIGSVVLLFSVVTTYGEAKLKAPPPIAGSYRLSAQNLPGCLKADALVLTIQQSGRYLSGSLLPEDNVKATAREKKLSLDGQLLRSDQHLSLKGPVVGIKSCNNSQLKIEGRVEEKAIAPQDEKMPALGKQKTLAGQITLGSNPEAAEFTAQQEEPVQKPKEH